MAVPKKRTGHSAQGHRRSNWKATKPEVTKCTNCGEVVLTHTVCTACGYYKGKAVSIKSADYVEATETKKAAKKAAPKAKAKKAEAEVEAKVEDVVVEETKTEEVKEKKTKTTSAKSETKTTKAEPKAKKKEKTED